MRWWVAALAMILALGLDTGLLGRLEVWELRPMASGVVVAFIALFAARGAVLWSAWVMGTLFDLCTALPMDAEHGGGVLFLIGPNALGLTAGAWVIMQMRTMVFRRRAITVGAMTVVGLIASGLVGTMVYVVRGWYPDDGVWYPTESSAALELARRLGSAFYSGLIGIPLGALLLATLWMWAFQTTAARR